MHNTCYINFVKNDKGVNVARFIFPDVDNDFSSFAASFKSWNFTTFNNEQMISYLKVLKSGNPTIIETIYGTGFVPIFVKHLSGLGFKVYNMDGTAYNMMADVKTVYYPSLKVQLRPYQRECFLKWERDRLGVIKAPTGSGKTIMAGAVIKECSTRTLILVHTIDLVGMWKESLTKTFGAEVNSTVRLFNAKNSLDEALQSNAGILIGTYQSAIKNLEKLKKYGIGLIVCDECHHVPADTFKHVLDTLCVPFKLGLSATPRRLDGKEGEIFALVDSVKASVAIKFLIANRYVVEPKFYNIKLFDTELSRGYAMLDGNPLQKTTWLKKHSTKSAIKLESLVKVLQNIYEKRETYLIFAEFVESANIIEQIVNRLFGGIKMVTQKMSSEERQGLFKKLGAGLRGLIFARLGSEGIDIPAVDNIIVVSPSKSPTTFSQRVGRGMRIRAGKKHCSIFQFIIKGTPEEDWAQYSFDEFRNEGFIPRNMVIR